MDHGASINPRHASRLSKNLELVLARRRSTTRRKQRRIRRPVDRRHGTEHGGRTAVEGGSVKRRRVGQLVRFCLLVLSNASADCEKRMSAHIRGLCREGVRADAHVRGGACSLARAREYKHQHNKHLAARETPAA